jgi:hypothetical protein
MGCYKSNFTSYIFLSAEAHYLQLLSFHGGTLSFIFYLSSLIFYISSFTFYHLPFFFFLFIFSVFFHLPSSFCHLLSVIFHLSSLIFRVWRSSLPHSNVHKHLKPGTDQSTAWRCEPNPTNPSLITGPFVRSAFAGMEEEMFHAAR